MPLWAPDSARSDQSQMTRFEHFIEDRHGLEFDGYADLHTWSVNHPEAFWQGVWEFTEIIASKEATAVLTHPDRFPGARWFEHSRLNFAENLLRFKDDSPAITGVLENGQQTRLTYRELNIAVATLARAMRHHGIGVGDRVAGLMPNVPEAVIAMLATTSIGAIWSSCSPDFGVAGAVDRFRQIEPRLLFTTEAYLYGGKTLDCLEKAANIGANINSIEQTIVTPLMADESKIELPPNSIRYADFVSMSDESSDLTAPDYEQLPFDHPLYIMYSSGTTGTPKCIVHGAGGTLIQHLKELKLHTDVKREDTLFYFTTCGWMMWNWLVSGLATGCHLVLFDGSPFAKSGTVLLDMIDDEGITVFGTSAKYIAALEKEGIKPKESHQLATLNTILSTGSPLSEASFDYVYRDIKTDVCLSSISGGTDIISCFMLGNPNLPVNRGEIQCAGLGMRVEFWNEQGEAVTNQAGELICAAPFPSAPIGFWNDPDQVRYRKAYFNANPGVWTHGDRGMINDAGGITVLGRSDAVLNPGGVRIGTAEIYRQVERLDQIIEAVAVGQNWQDDERIVLFVVLKNGITLDTQLQETINLEIRQNTTPRHVPAKIIQVPDIPRTISGKIVELGVRAVIHNQQVDNLDALANPEALEHYRNLPELEE